MPYILILSCLCMCCVSEGQIGGMEESQMPMNKRRLENMIDESQRQGGRDIGM